MYCDHCGKPIADKQPFCTNCGTPVASLGNAPAPSNAPVSEQAAPDVAADAATAVSAQRRRWPIIAIAAAAILALIAGTVFVTYRAEIWGGKTLPTVEQIAEGNEPVTAKKVKAKLEILGFTSVSVVSEFSSEDSGTFLRYEGTEAGSRTSTSTPITVVESLGPGVPKGTIGLSQEDAVAELQSMGVDIRTAPVAVSSTSATQQGTVAASFPTEGNAMAADADAIVLGIATEGAGVGIDLIGQDKDDVKSALESQGFAVTLVPKFTSEDYVGKMVTSHPEPGVFSSSSDVTVYYGVDASSAKETLTQAESDETGPTQLVADVREATFGRYCTADGQHCLTINRDSKQDADDDTSITGLSAGTYISNGCPAAPYGTYDATDEQICISSFAREQKNRLIDTDTGAFDLTDTTDALRYQCGTDEVTFSQGAPIGKICKNGTKDSDAVFFMTDYRIYFPAHTDVNALIELGIFDDDAVAEAAQQEAADTSRPFILSRDASLYDSTETAFDAKSTNPYTAPMLNDDGTARRSDFPAFKPAVSNETVYYLDETSLATAWTTQDADSSSKDGEDAASKKDADASTGSKEKEEKEGTEEKAKDGATILAEIKQGDFSDVAGKYCRSDSDCITLDAAGNLDWGAGANPMTYNDEDLPNYYNLVQSNVEEGCNPSSEDAREMYEEYGMCAVEDRISPRYYYLYPGNASDILQDYAEMNLQGTPEDKPFLIQAIFPAMSLSLEGIYYLQE